jgi:hypothetical protein
MFMRLTRKISMRFFAAAIISLSWFLTFQPGSSAKDQNMNVIAHASSGPLVCEIRRIGAGESVQLSGVLSSASAAAGTFRFLLKKTGPSGNSNVNQGNAFNLAAGGEVHVGNMTINLRPDDQATVELSATSKDGVVCRVTAALAIEL